MTVSTLLKALSLLSLGGLYRIADFFDPFIATFPNRASRLIRQNIQLCFPDLNSDEQRQLCRLTIRHSCYSAFELAAVWCWPVEKILARITSENVCGSFHASKKGRIVVVPHLGNWELVNLYLAQQGDLVSLYKTQTNAAVDSLLLTARSRNGAHLMPANISGLRQLSLALKQGKTVMILPDHRPEKNKSQLMATFFGVEAPVAPLIYKFCKRIDCDIFIATIFRNRDDASFHLDLNELEHEKITVDQQSGLNYLNSQLEFLIKQHPEQYQWAYRRFDPSTYHALVAGEV
jgi:KDO2-lipid IV(A) lauroyltransferase